MPQSTPEQEPAEHAPFGLTSFDGRWRYLPALISPHAFSASCLGADGWHASHLGPAVLFVVVSMHSKWFGQQKSPAEQSSLFRHLSEQQPCPFVWLRMIVMSTAAEAELTRRTRSTCIMMGGGARRGQS